MLGFVFGLVPRLFCRSAVTQFDLQYGLESGIAASFLIEVSGNLTYGVYSIQVGQGSQDSAPGGIVVLVTVVSHPSVS